MPTIDKHMQRSSEKTGKDYREVHECIDDCEKGIERHGLSRVVEFGNKFDSSRMISSHGSSTFSRMLKSS